MVRMRPIESDRPRRLSLMARLRGGLLAGLAALLPLAAPAQPAGTASAPGAAPQKVLRYAIRVAETGFDPAQISDLYSRTIAAAIFDAPLQWEFLARPVRYRPNTLVALPEVSDDFKTFTFRLKPGIYFADDPAFKGQKRELVAADYVYSWKRLFDPRWKSPSLYGLEEARILGLDALRKDALTTKKPFDYDREVEGLRTLDRYTFQVKLAEPSPRFLNDFTDSSVAGAVAREVVEFYGDKIMEHPVGTGPFRLVQWRRASKMVLERNPNYRDVFYNEEAPANDPLAQAAAAKLKGRKLPMIDRVEVSVIEENQPRWLAFVNAQHDYVEEVPQDFADQVMPNNELAPNLKKRGIQMVRYPRADVYLSYFNMEDPVVGGYTPDKVALRRAISLAIDTEKEIRLVRRGQAVRAQGIVSPGVWGYSPDFRTEMGVFDPARAKGLLDLYGYVDKDGDGWRDLPHGRPLTLEYATQPDQLSRQLTEQWQRNMAAIGIRIVFKPAKWPENLKASTAGKLQMWGLGWSLGAPDGQGFLSLGYGPAKTQSNKSRFDLPAFNEAFAKQKVLPNGPERQAAIDEAQRLMVTYMPLKAHYHRVYTDVAHPWVIGFHRNVFIREAWRWVDIDVEMQQRLAKP
jgi:ABC-type transport system substrate-binding protein